MCCLGVATDLFLDGDWELDPDPYAPGYVYIGESEIETSAATPTLKRLMGFDVGLGFVVDNVGQNIAQINDASFDSRKADYGNVLPHIIEYYNKNKHPAEPEVK
jgi:hypothetical protein